VKLAEKSGIKLFAARYERGLYAALKYLTGECELFVLSELDELILRDKNTSYSITPVVEASASESTPEQ
jgi:hypothetical protein